MIITIPPNLLSGHVKAISSKSHAHRAFICAALGTSTSTIICNDVSEDILATIEYLIQLSAIIVKKDDTYQVNPLNKNVGPTDIILNCKESGSTLRFLLPITAALGKNATIKASGRLPDRPISELTKQLRNHGVAVEDLFPLKLSGKLSGGIYSLPGNVSSQYISGLLMAAPLTKQELTIKATSELESIPYIDMTIKVMEDFGVKVHTEESCFCVSDKQNYKHVTDYIIEGDWSNAAFWLCAGALGNGITMTGLSLESRQGDKEIINILKSIGAEIKVEDDSITVKKGTILPFEIDAKDIPDLVPIFAVLATAAVGKSKIYNAKRLKLKESDRLYAVSSQLNLLGANITETEDGLIINGTGSLKGGIASAMGDHRIAMSLAIASLISKNNITISNADAVNKSYPTFFLHFRDLGGTIISK